MGPARFGAVVTAMVTPFRPDGALDVDAAVALARWLADNGSDGLVLAGTTGEGPVLTDDERVELWRAVASAVTVPVVAGSASNDTAHSIELTKAASSTGVAGVLIVTPYYNRPSQEGLYAHFRAVAGATDLPVLLYDIPVRTGRRIAAATTLRLVADCPNVVGVKDAAGDPVASARLVAHAPDHFDLYCGDDALTLPLVAVGAVGVVSVCSHWAGAEMGQMVAAAHRGDLESARKLNARLIGSYDFETSEDFPNPLPAKAAMRALGHSVGHCRLPMGPCPPELDGEAYRMMVRLDAVSLSHAVGPVG